MTNLNKKLKLLKEMPVSKIEEAINHYFINEPQGIFYEDTRTDFSRIDSISDIYRVADEEDGNKIREAACNILIKSIPSLLESNYKRDNKFLSDLGWTVKRIEPEKYNNIDQLQIIVDKVIKDGRYRDNEDIHLEQFHRSQVCIRGLLRRPAQYFDFWEKDLKSKRGFAQAYEAVILCEDVPKIAKAFWIVFNAFVTQHRLNGLLKETDHIISQKERLKELRKAIIKAKPSDLDINKYKSIFNEYNFEL